MPTPSPLAALVATLANVCHQAHQNHALLSKNEAATRAALIDPVLRALGWDTADVRMVEPERTVENKQSLDYVLKGPTGAIQSVVEAKKLGESLDKLGHVGALIGYAFSLKPVSFFITDGLNWHCYSPGHSHYEPTSTIELRSDNLLAAALQLLQLLDAAHSGHGLNPVPIVASAANTALASPSTKPQPRQPIKALASGQAKKYYPLSVDLTDPAKQLGKPQWLRLPDGTEHQLKNWKDILIQASELVLRSRPDLSLPLPDKAGKKTALIRWEQPTSGLSFTSVIYQGKPAFIYTNYSAASCLINALYLFQLLPKSKSDPEPGIAFGN
ncbi:hypothetical protein [Hymenobacter sp. BRD67]|uniref:hypothetical protein n=1 Tax=Hymenobacter sp. BRD67 TaxID=2675877 RepID=UPI0015648A3B|nr:hypothetical protein [Hymenobacter sp. BRD67]QKG51510.1 hypothetical protein GKZ67_01540 [Hymenobacter sp. BRD67]